MHKKILSYPGVLGTHDLMIHDYGPGRQFASAHVKIAADTSLRRSHALIDSIEQGLREQENISFVLHCDPVEAKDDMILSSIGAALGISNLVTASVIERRMKIGLLKAIGEIGRAHV